jgi:hypothetical protein
MCCLFATLMFFGPRLAFLIYWLIPRGQLRVELAFNSWILGFLGWLFLPWATMMYVIVYPVHGFDWVFLGLALLADIVSYSGGAFNRRRVPGYRGP